MTETLRDWLVSLDLAHLTGLFEEHQVTLRDLPLLQDDDLKELGVALGPRRRILHAIAKSVALEEFARPDMLSDEPSFDEAERRQLTVMFCDLVGSTEMSLRMDPEDLRDLMRRYQDVVAGSVVRYGGHVANFLGDGVLAYFGWPHAHEDQAERAVWAGLDATDAVALVRYTDEETLHARVGIATGQVVVGHITSAAAAETEAVTGQTPNLAARLQGVALPNQVIIDTTTRQLVGGTFEFRDLGRRHLKGFAERQPIWRVIGTADAATRYEAGHQSGISPIVGRVAEREVLEDCWDRARAGAGQAVVIGGEAGIGKSRLVQALRDQVASQDHYRLRYQCVARLTDRAFHPIIQTLEHASGIAAKDSSNEKLEKLEAMLEYAGDDVATVAPLFASLLSIPGEARYGPLDLTPERLRDRIMDALVRQLILLSRQRPVLVIMEDVHWIDPTTETLIGRVLDGIADRPVMIVITHRLTYRPPWLKRDNIRTLLIDRLDRRESEALVASIGAELPQETIERIAARAEGVPLYLEEVTKNIIEAGLGQEMEVESSAIPDSLQASLMARLDNLNSTKQLLQIGAVIGRTFSHELISKVAGRSDDELHRDLERSANAGLIRSRDEGGSTVYMFRHALFQDAAYATLLRSRRRYLHSQIADVLRRDFPRQAEAEPEVMANHFALADRAGEAAEYWLAAGRRAGQRSAHLEAISSLNKALAQLELLDPTDDRDGREFETRLTLGASLIAAEGWAAPDVQDNYERAMVLSQSVGDIHQKVNALRGLTNVAFLKGQISVARTSADRELEIGREEDDLTLMMGGHRAVGMCAFFAGDFRTAREHLRHNNAIYDRDQHGAQKFLQGTDPAVIGMSVLSWTDWFLGDGEAARNGIEAALRHAQDLDHPFSLAYGESLAASVYQVLAEPATVLAHAEKGIALAEENDYPYWLAWSTIMRGWAVAALGEADRGIDILNDGLAAYEATGARQIKPYVLTLLAEMYGWAKRPADGLACLDHACGSGNETDVRFYEAEAFRQRGEFHRLAARSDGVADYREALSVSERQQSPTLILRAAVGLAKAELSIGRIDEARAALSAGMESAGLADENPDMKNARTLFAELRD